MAQAELFVAAIQKAELAEMRNNMIAMRAASADNKSFKKMLKELGDG